jgi:hypothetical protein
MAAVAFHPMPLDSMRRGRFDQFLPQLRILDWLFVGRAPAVALPIVNPARDSITNVDTVGVKPNPARTFQGLETFDRGHQLHLVVGRERFPTRELALLVAGAEQRRPAARTRIAAAGAVGEDLDERKFGQATSSRGSLNVMRSGE